MDTQFPEYEKEQSLYEVKDFGAWFMGEIFRLSKENMDSVVKDESPVKTETVFTSYGEPIEIRYIDTILPKKHTSQISVLDDDNTVIFLHTFTARTVSAYNVKQKAFFNSIVDSIADARATEVKEKIADIQAKFAGHVLEAWNGVYAISNDAQETYNLLSQWLRVLEGKE